MSTLSRREFLASMGVAAAGATVLATGCTPVAATGAKDSAIDLAATGSSIAATGTAMGKRGNVEVGVVVTDGNIDRIELLSSHETNTLGDFAFDNLTHRIIENQTLNVDTISGATISSMAILSAVGQALDNMGLSASDWQSRDAAPQDRETPIPTDADIVVVGSGGAGLSAAITASEEGKNVVLLEKMGVMGGSTSLSGGETAGPGTWLQRKEGIEDNPELLMEDMLVGGDDRGDPALVKVIADNALDTVDWLTYNAGASWAPKLMFFGGHSVKRGLVTASHSGSELTSKCITRLGDFDALTICRNAKATRLVTGANGVEGIEVEDQLSGETTSISCNAVILATGGFGANVEMRAECNPDYGDQYLATCAKGAMGEGIQMGVDAGAATIDLELIQTYPNCDPENGSLLYTGDFRVEDRAIMVNKEGKRFVEELERRDVLSQAIVAQTEGVGYIVFTDKAEEDLRLLSDVYPEEYENVSSRGILVHGNTLEEACEPFGVDATALRQTIDTWNGYCEQGTDLDFNYRSVMNPIETDGGFYLLKNTPAVHYTMGGLRINTEAEVLDGEGKAIPGLFAAGEVAGGKMGTNRLGTTSMVDIFTFGRIAGRNASQR